VCLDSAWVHIKNPQTGKEEHLPCPRGCKPKAQACAIKKEAPK
jgi:hypothetical protein